MLALSRSIPAADGAMKAGKWEKKRFLGTEVRGKTLGVAGLGRIGQEVAQRARAFGMRVVAHDPYISKEIAAGLGVELMSLDEVCATADYLTLHLPSTPETKHLFNDARFARCKPGIRIINTARGELIDEAALRRAIEAGIVGGAGLDVFETEPPADWSLAQLPQVIATPHIAASTEEAQELVGTRNRRHRPRLPARRHRAERRELPVDSSRRTAAAAAVDPAGRPARRDRVADGHGAHRGARRPLLRRAGREPRRRRARRQRRRRRAAADPVERRLDRERPRRRLARAASTSSNRAARGRATSPACVSIKLTTDAGDRWVEGTVFEPNSPRLVSVRGVDVEAPLGGTMLIIANDDQPGVIGEVGTILGRHGVNIANFALGRGRRRGAIGVVNVDEDAERAAARSTKAVEELAARSPAIREAWVVRLG